MKKIFFAFALYFSFIGCFSAESLINDEEYQIVEIVEKYYKTEIFNDANAMLLSTDNTYAVTTEISKEEYENEYESIIKPRASVYVETEYKKMTTTISTNGSNFRYKVLLNWKKFPKVRSYDIISLSFYQSVKPSGNIYFSQNYCLESGICKSSASSTQNIENDGVSAIFKLPGDNLTSLSSTLYFDVAKSTSATVIRQNVVGDYAHATKSISLTNAKKHTLNLSGISLDSSIVGNYDEITPAKIGWTGSW